MARNAELRNEYLKFIREYIDENHCAPRLEEIAQHFSVTEPTAHNMLISLEEEGFLYFDRDDLSGFFIRIIERVGTTSSPWEIGIMGGLDRYGKLLEFPKKHGHFPIVMPNYDVDQLFALQAWQHIPQADILANDLLLFDRNPDPRLGGICIIPIGNEWFLVRLISQDEDGRFLWNPIAYDEDTKEIYISYFEKKNVMLISVEKELILASAIALKRTLTI